MDDTFPDVGELVAASIPVHVWVEHVYVHRRPDVPLLVCIVVQYPYTKETWCFYLPWRVYQCDNVCMSSLVKMIINDH